jgi:hypothetical protein
LCLFSDTAQQQWRTQEINFDKPRAANLKKRTKVPPEATWAGLPIMVCEFSNYTRVAQISTIIASKGRTSLATNEATGCSVEVEDRDGTSLVVLVNKKRTALTPAC